MFHFKAVRKSKPGAVTILDISLGTSVLMILSLYRSSILPYNVIIVINICTVHTYEAV